MGIRTAAMRSFVAISAVLVLACGGGGKSSNPPPPSTASVTVVNNTSLPLTEVYISLSTSSTWGANQITSSIPAGGSRTITSIPPGTYDLKAVAQDGSYATSMGHALAAGGTYTWTITQNPNTTTSLYVHNTSSYTVGYLYVVPSPSGANGSWGSDQLGTYTIAPGATFTLTGVPVGTYDLRATQLGGSIYWQHLSAYIPSGGYTWTLTN